MSYFRAYNGPSQDRRIATRLTSPRKTNIFVSSEASDEIEWIKQFLLIRLTWAAHVTEPILSIRVIGIRIDTRVLIIEFGRLETFIDPLIFANALIRFIIASIATGKIYVGCLGLRLDCDSWSRLLWLRPLVFHRWILEIHCVLFAEVCIPCYCIAAKLNSGFLLVNRLVDVGLYF